MSAIIDRTLISRGPALVKFKTGTFFSSNDITLDWALENESVPSSAYGPVFPYRKGLKPSLKIPLVGEVEHLDLLFPFGALKYGQSIFGATDTPVEVIPIDTNQKKTVFANGAIVAEPELTLGVSGGIALGETSFRFLPAKGKALTDPAAWFTQVLNDWDGTGFDPSKILIQSYDISWLSGGTIDFTFGGNTAAEKAYNISAADLQTALNALADVTTAGGVTVEGDYKAGWKVTFVENGAQGDFSGTVTGMPGGMELKQTVLQAGTAGAPQIVLLQLSPWAWFPNEDAVKVKIASKLNDQMADSIGVYDITFESTEATATFIPLNVNDVTLAAAANLQGANAALGRNLTASAHHLDIYATGLYVRLYAAHLTKAGSVWSATKQRVPSLEWTASRTLSDGVVQPIYYVGTAAPGA